MDGNPAIAGTGHLNGFQKLGILLLSAILPLSIIISLLHHPAFGKCTTGTHYISTWVSTAVPHLLTCHQGPSSAVHRLPTYYPPSSSLHHPTFGKCWCTLHQHTGQYCCSPSTHFTVYHHPTYHPLPSTICLLVHCPSLSTHLPMTLRPSSIHGPLCCSLLISRHTCELYHPPFSNLTLSNICNKCIYKCMHATSKTHAHPHKHNVHSV